MKLGKLAIVLVIVMVAAFIVGAAILATDIPALQGKDLTPINEQAQVNGKEIVTIDVISASVAVVPSNTDKIEVALTGRGAGEELPTLLVTEQGNEVRIMINRPDGWWLSSIVQDLQLTVKLPAAVDLDARSTSGRVEVIGIETKKCTIESVSGSILFDPAAEQGCNLETTSGSIKATSLTGSSVADSTSGSVVLEGVSGSVVAKTTSGSVKVTYNTVFGENTLSSVSGSVKIVTPASADYTFKGKSTSGHISAAGLILEEASDKFVIAKKGVGTNSIYAETTSGSVTIS